MTERDYKNWANDWRGLSSREIYARLKANNDLNDLLDLLLITIEKLVAEYKIQLVGVVNANPDLAANPGKAEEFIKSALADSGYSNLKSTLEAIQNGNKPKEMEGSFLSARPLNEAFGLFISPGKAEEFTGLEKILISKGFLNQTDYRFKEKKEVIAFAFIVEEKNLVSFKTYAKFEREFGARYSEDLNKDFAPVKRKVVSKQIDRLKSCFRSSGLSGFETT